MKLAQPLPEGRGVGAEAVAHEDLCGFSGVSLSVFVHCELYFSFVVLVLLVRVLAPAFLFLVVPVPVFLPLMSSVSAVIVRVVHVWQA